MSYIEINNLTKDFGEGRGVFNVDLKIEKGEVFGFVGTNGSGKTTTIRHLMGFSKPQRGNVKINGLDCWENAAEVKKLVGYIPGEIAFPDLSTGTEFLTRQAELLNMKDLSQALQFIQNLQLDPSANLKRMSKGMKQKTAIVAALMADREILILDEPTTGLDPLMRKQFIEIIKEEKKKGKTIFMSSHMFEEVEETCDKVALIKGGKIIAIKSTSEVKHNENKEYNISFISSDDYEQFILQPFEMKAQDEQQRQVTILIQDSQINTLFQSLRHYNVKSIVETKYTLEQYFNGLYEGGNAHA